MDLNKYLPESADEYIKCFRQLGAHINCALDFIEAKTNWVSIEDKKDSLLRIEESIETISCLRGDTEIFLNSRPDDLIGYQKEMYSIEDYLRVRLLNTGFKSAKRQ